MRAARPPLGLALVGPAALAAIACSGVLGLDAPALDPCETTACPDAAVDGGATDGASDALADARNDAAPLVGIRCGGGAFPETGCTAGAVCCQITDDAGATTYACRASTGACEGLPIACATNNDCSGNAVCCERSTGLACTTGSCANASLVCEPSGPADQCPAGWTCKAAATLDGVPSPYFTCAP